MGTRFGRLSFGLATVLFGVGPLPAQPAAAAEAQLVATTRVSVSDEEAQGTHNSTEMSISADGRYVAFQSSASNLVAGDTNGVWDVFVRQRS